MLPEGLEAGTVADGAPFVTAVVVRVDYGIGAFGLGDVVDCLCVDSYQYLTGRGAVQYRVPL